MTLKTYRIGGLRLRLEADEPIDDADFFPLFRTDYSAAPDVTVTVLRRPLPQPEVEELTRTDRRRSVRAGGTLYEYTCFPDPVRRQPVPYACAVRHGAEMTLYVDHSAPLWDTMLFNAIGLPDLLLERAAVIVHAAFIGAGEDGILFAGPPDQGKTTQALLWQTHRNAVVINGDRAVLRETPRGVTAYGIPFAGSSRLCRNEERPVRAIVFPEKDADNTVTALAPFEGFKRLIGCFSYTQTDPAAQDRALRMAERIATECRCWRLRCRPDAEAVAALAEALERNT